jgi:hypothetical protein
MKKNLYFLCLVSLFINQAWSQKTTEKIVQSAQLSLLNTLNIIPQGQEQKYGFNQRADFNIAVVGKPIQVVTLSSAFFENPNNKEIIFLNEWRVPIMVNQKTCTLFTVQKNNADFEVVDMGGSILGQELENKISENDSALLLRIFPLQIDFMVKTQSDNHLEEAVYFPMESAKRIISAEKYQISYNQNDFFQLIRTIYSEQQKN